MVYTLHVWKFANFLSAIIWSFDKLGKVLLPINLNTLNLSGFLWNQKKKRMGLITPLVIFPAGKFKYNTKAKTLSKEKKKSEVYKP